MKVNSSKIMLAVFLAGASVCCCYARTNAVTNAFQAADTNLDGKISREEFKQHARQTAFENADKNRDKKIDKKEWLSIDRSPAAEQNFEAVDKDRNQQIQFLEFSDHAEKNYNYDEVFNALDRNRDGSLAPDEFNDRPAFTILSIKF